MWLQVSMAVRECGCAADAREENWACEPNDEGRLERNDMNCVNTVVTKFTIMFEVTICDFKANIDK